MKPENEKGSGIPLFLSMGLFTGIMFWNSFCNLSDNPNLMALFKPNVFNKSISVKCSPFFFQKLL